MKAILWKNNQRVTAWDADTNYPREIQANPAKGALAVVLQDCYEHRSEKSIAEERDEIARGVSDRKRSSVFKGSGYYSGNKLVIPTPLCVDRDYETLEGDIYRITVE